MANELWKQVQIQRCLDMDILSSDEWLYKTDDLVPVWMICTMMNNLVDKLAEDGYEYALV